MASPYQDPGLSEKPYYDPTPMPESVPHVQELGTTSAPLKSAAFFIGDACKDYNEDFMLCKAESRNPEHCLKEGRRITRCAADVINKMNESCLKEFTAHWSCLEKNNQVRPRISTSSPTSLHPSLLFTQEYYACRKAERKLNTCVFQKLGWTKTIPGSPEGKTPIHLVENPIYKTIQK
ncbi:NADH dehydrogenase alpha subcomplex subunit 8 [Schizopora paradoxa]|uniref:NADH-ubiquinone oxidoreductase n=1 Tax=Schizopora paradoxa TaxID=27342 RepID=A0A0H2S2E6_9AGAM|nr:NADH dehydrogenase alpha subcomplex subunit 8 [Schizopora paradoxa]